ncbi:MAG: T9SS type A sorting domain-containing protein [Bacteroidota bacterium]
MRNNDLECVIQFCKLVTRFTHIIHRGIKIQGKKYFYVYVDGCWNDIYHLEQKRAFFKLYPNPSDGNFYAEITPPIQGRQGGVSIKITILNGHLKTTIPVTSEKTLINTSGWAKGTYVCNLVIDGKLVRSEKMVLK